MKSLCRVQLFVTPWSAAYQAPPSMGFSRQEYWSGVPLSSPLREHRPVFVLPMAVFHELSCQGRAVPHTVISRILLLPLLVALPFITHCLHRIDSDWIIGASTFQFLDKPLITLAHISLARSYSYGHTPLQGRQRNGVFNLSTPEPSLDTSTAPASESSHRVWLDEFQPLLLHYYYYCLL